MQRHRILIVDDHPLMREGLAQIVNRQTDLVACGESSTPTETVQAVNEHQPEVVVLDLRLRDADGLDLIKDLKQRFPSTRVLVLSQCDELTYAERALRSGALGYIMKEQASMEVVKALRTVLKNEVYVSPRVAARLLHTFVGAKSMAPSAGVERLSDRELHVLRLVGSGMRTGEIATELGVSVKTVETYRQNLKHKLNLGSGAELVNYAAQWVAETVTVIPAQN